jgi:hypothetical protein
MDRSSTREKLIEVLPTRGASRHVASVRMPYKSSVNVSLVLIDRGAAPAWVIADSEVITVSA